MTGEQAVLRAPRSRAAARQRVAAHGGAACALALACSLTFAAGPAAPPAERGAAQPAAGTIDYVAQPGDSLYNVADRYLRDPGQWPVLQRLNHVANPEHLQPGTTLRLPETLLRQDSQAAEAIAVNGPVTHAFRGGAPIPLEVGMKLVEGDHVQTGDNGFATLELPDGTHVTVVPDSQFTVETLRQTVLTGSVDRVLELKRGEVDSEVTHATKKDDRFQIRAPSVVAGVRGTGFRVNYDDSAHSTAVEVLNGAVGVDPASAAAPKRGVPLAASGQLVTAGHGNVTASGGSVGAPVPLLPPPEAIHAGRVQDAPQVAFDLKPLDGARGYRVQIGRDAGLFDLIRDVHSANPHVVVGPLDDGTYFVRATAIDPAGLEGMPATYGFERRQMAGAAASAGPAGRNYVFKWIAARASVPTHYRFVLAASEDLRAPLVDRADLAGGGITVSDLPKGTYYWTVIAEQFDHGKFYQKVGPVQSFRIDE